MTGILVFELSRSVHPSLEDTRLLSSDTPFESAYCRQLTRSHGLALGFGKCIDETASHCHKQNNGLDRLYVWSVDRLS